MSLDHQACIASGFRSIQMSESCASMLWASQQKIKTPSSRKYRAPKRTPDDDDDDLGSHSTVRHMP
eukprot:scaffold3522_cov82-Skeletonema_dohrnii-CCMP3373.AAC.5